MYVSDFEQRRKRILEAIIEAYVSTAAPVGSQLISKQLQDTLSPATIRNVMVKLEKAGLLTQPHTSAGRIPTEQGYRFYVDSVMDVPWLTNEGIREIRGLIHSDDLEPDQLPERVSAVLAELTGQAAFVVVPTVKQSTLRQIELVPLSVRKLLCVLVGSEVIYSSHVIEVEEPLTVDEAAALGRFINTEFVGLRFDELLESLERRLLAEDDSFYYLVKRSLAILQHALSTEPTSRFYLGGTSHVVAQPEFRRDPERAQLLLKGLESQHGLIEQIQDAVATGTVQVRIGHEVNAEGFEGCSYISAPFTMGKTVAGGIGILGPTRMDYRRMSRLVDGAARSVTDLLNAGHADAP